MGSLSAEERRRLKQRARRLDEGLRTRCSPALVELYRFRPLRKRVAKVAARLEGDVYFSHTMREIFQTYYGIEVGMYTYGLFEEPERYPRGTSVGRYGSIGPRTVPRFVPRDCPAMHPVFHDATLGLVDETTEWGRPRPPLEIGHDVYGGFAIVTTPECSKIGDGAVIGTAAVLTEDVPAYSIVAGDPARVIRKRFSDEVEDLVRESRWFEHSISELVEDFEAFINPASVAVMKRLMTTLDHSDEEIDAAHEMAAELAPAAAAKEQSR